MAAGSSPSKFFRQCHVTCTLSQMNFPFVHIFVIYKLFVYLYFAMSVSCVLPSESASDLCDSLCDTQLAACTGAGLDWHQCHMCPTICCFFFCYCCYKQRHAIPSYWKSGGPPVLDSRRRMIFAKLF